MAQKARLTLTPDTLANVDLDPKSTARRVGSVQALGPTIDIVVLADHRNLQETRVNRRTGAGK